MKKSKSYWRRWYVGVLLWLAALIFLFAWFTNSWK
jgi:hypothetical protein